MKRIVGLVAASTLIVGVAVAQGQDTSRSAAPDQCVARPFGTTRVIDEKTLYVDDRSGRAVLLHMSGACLLSDREPVSLEFRGGTARICDPLDVDVTGTATTTPVRCIIRSVEALTPEQAATYRK